jgi:hypothetical protein
MRSHWLTKRIFRRPTALKPATDGHDMNTESVRKITQASSHSTHGKHAIAALISGLLLACLPTHVSGFVAPIVINSPDSHSGGWFSNVFKKCGEVIPLLTNENPATAVIRELLVVGVSASVQHCSPNPIKLGLFSFSAVTVLQEGTIVHSFPAAPTRLNTSVSEIRKLNRFLFAAFASTPNKPYRLTSLGRSWRSIAENLKFTEHQSSGEQFGCHMDEQLY